MCPRGSAPRSSIAWASEGLIALHGITDKRLADTEPWEDQDGTDDRPGDE